jgi:hypothetical protein
MPHFPIFVGHFLKSESGKIQLFGYSGFKCPILAFSWGMGHFRIISFHFFVTPFYGYQELLQCAFLMACGQNILMGWSAN